MTKPNIPPRGTPIGAGSVFPHPERPTWVAQIYFRDDDGRKRRRTLSAGTEEEARALLPILRKAITTGIDPDDVTASPSSPAGTVFYSVKRERWVGQHRWMEGGKRKAKTAFRATEEEARAALREMTTASEEGRAEVPTGGTLRRWLRFYGDHVLPTEGLAPSSVVDGQGYINRELVGSELGAVQMASLTPLDVHRYLAALTASGAGASKVKQVRNILVKALRAAVLYDRLDARVVEGIKGQPVRRKKTPRRAKPKMLSSGQARALRTAAEDTGWEPLITVLLGTGLRRGEVLALRWRDIDFDAGTMEYVGAIADNGHGAEFYGQTKTGVESTDLLAPMVLSALHRQRSTQAAARLAYRGDWAAGDEYDDFVFTDETGHRLRADHVTRKVRQLAAGAGISITVTPHMLRHSAASFLFEQGAPVEVISAVLHHASERITRDVYIHLTQSSLATGREALEAMLRDLAE